MTRSGRRVYKARTAGTMFHVKHSGLFIDEHHLTHSRSQATRAGGTLGVAREGEGGGQVTTTRFPPIGLDAHYGTMFHVKYLRCSIDGHQHPANRVSRPSVLLPIAVQCFT